MSLFDWLLVGHLLGDFIFQSDRMARHKAQNWQWMFRHVGLYTVVVTATLLIYAWLHPVPWWAVVAASAFLFATHVVLDRRHLEVWWMRRAGIDSERTWLLIVVDQVCHVVTIAIVAQTLALVQP